MHLATISGAIRLLTLWMAFWTPLPCLRGDIRRAAREEGEVHVTD
jgi:hypothetical protein